MNGTEHISCKKVILCWNEWCKAADYSLFLCTCPRNKFDYSLHAQLLKVESKSRKEWVLTDEGQHVLEHGSHEAAVYNAVPADGNGAKQADILSKVPFAKVGLSKALAAQWIELVKSENDTFIKRKVPSITDEIQKHLKELQTLSDDSKKEYKKRKLIKEK